jgi:putative nucleotidyltransferase with HDIG domain
MLKRIAVADLRVGMHLHELCGSWLDHPFWKASFLIEDAKELKRIVDSGIAEAWIDTAKGLDLETGGQAKEASDAAIERELIRGASQPHIVERIATEKEVARAAKICGKARQAVSSMFREARMGKALDAQNALPLVEEISNSVLRNPGALISLARLKTKDDYTYMHSVAVCALMVALARQVGLDEAQTREAGMAGLLHDIGKMMVPSDILNKPGRLTDEEFVSIRGHPEAGHAMLLEGSGVSDVALDVCLHHHEKTDGSGYPHRLSGEQISLFAKMGAVCDVYDAITSDRPYKSGWGPADSLRKMAEWSKGHFDDGIFKAFVKTVGIYPVGSLVLLQSGRLGVVVDQTAQSLLTPKVKVFYSTKAKVRLPPEIIDLSRPEARDKILSHEDPAKWAIPDLQFLWSGITGPAW